MEGLLWPRAYNVTIMAGWQASGASTAAGLPPSHDPTDRLASTALFSNVGQTPVAHDLGKPCFQFTANLLD